MNTGQPRIAERRRGVRQRWRHLPVRWRLTAWYAALLAAAFVLLGVAVYVGLRLNFYRALDEQVEDQTALILVTIQEQGGALILYPRDIGDLENDEHFVRLLANDGRVIADTSAALGGVPLDNAVIDAALAGETQLTSAVANGETIRLVTAPVTDGNEVSGVLQVGISREEIDEALWTLVLTMTISVPVVLLAAITAGYALSGRAMAPVGEITHLAASIDADDLRARLNLDLPDDELGRLAITFDAMLGRIEEAFDQQRRFTDAAAHELRTPLSLMRSQVDLALLDERSVEEYRDALYALQDDIERLSGLVNALLALARDDAGQLELSPAPFDLADTIEAVGEQFAVQANEAGIRLRQDTAPCAIVADEDLLVQVLVNLVANALVHTPDGGTVMLGCQASGAEARFWVSDTGIGIPPEHRERVFDRFYRVDHRSGPGRRGAGLGLSISRTIVAAHGGRIGLTSDPGQGTTVQVTFPTVDRGQRSSWNPAPVQVSRAHRFDESATVQDAR